MRNSVLFAIIAFVFAFAFTATSWAQGEKLPWPKRVDEQIRALEDPDYAEYLKEREREKKRLRMGIQEVKEHRQREKEAYERSRKARIKWREQQVEEDQWPAWQKHIAGKRARKQRQAEARQQRSQIRYKHEQKQLLMQARFRQRLDIERLPATTEPDASHTEKTEE
jgi:uncharacterized membrane protein YccC